MKFTIAILALVSATVALSLSASAAVNSEQIKAVLEAQPSCQKFVRYDDKNLYLGFGAYRQGMEEPRHPIPASMTVAPLDGSAPYRLPTNDAALDFVTDGDTGFLLTYSSIEEWNLTTKTRVAEYETYAINGELKYMQHAQAMARYKDKLIIAHGRLGISIFNMKTRRLDNQFRLLQSQAPYESMAVGVTMHGNLAYILIDSFTLSNPGQKSAFKGFVIFNMDTEQVVAQLEGTDGGTDSVISDDNKVIVSFGGIPIWKYDFASLNAAAPSKTMPEPILRIWKFPIKGHPTGAPSMDDKYYYTCFSKAPSYPGENGGHYTNAPMALDRRVLMLD